MHGQNRQRNPHPPKGKQHRLDTGNRRGHGRLDPPVHPLARNLAYCLSGKHVPKVSLCSIFFFFWLTRPDTPSNHGSFFHNQFAALKILIGDLDGARQVIQRYFATTWQHQIWANGEQVGLRRASRCSCYSPLPHQPFEMIRTRPYHYRAYNLNAMIVRPRPSLNPNDTLIR